MKAMKILAVGLLAASASTSMAANVKVTPLGSHDGEFCKFDRTMVFEDADGPRILYDARRTVAGADDPHLGKIDALLVSHMRGNHVGDRHISAVNAGICGKVNISVKVAPNTNTVNIALAKKAKLITGGEMPKIFANKLKARDGNPKDSQLVRFGSSIKVVGVSITAVPAVHLNRVAGAFIDGELGKLLDAAGLSASVGPPTGYVLIFSNSLPCICPVTRESQLSRS
jgi:hypothetical protein